MLYLVLVLVITAFVLLITALTTATTLWAWISVGISVLAAVLLVLDWVRGRRRVAATTAPRQPDEPPPDELLPDEPALDEPSPAELDRAGDGIGAAERVEPPPVERATQALPVEERPAVADATDRPADDDEPEEEATDAADLLVVSDLNVEVRVVDEHPRYHLSGCGWLAGKPTIPLPVSEARQLGFTPCTRCGPDAALAARHRAGRGAKQ